MQCFANSALFEEGPVVKEQEVECFSDSSRKMDEQTRLFLERVNAIQLPDIESMSIEEMRRFFDQSVVKSSIQLASVFDITIPGPQTQIPLRIYVPEGKGPFPVLISIHGGGWVLGNLDSHDPFCRSIAKQANVMVVSIDYRLAPEHKYPAAVSDCMAAVNWVAAHIQEWGGDSSNLFIAGISSGGNLAAAVTLKAKEQKFPIFRAQALICPVMQYRFNTHSYQRCSEGYLLTKEKMQWFWDLYLDNKVSDGQEPYASPLNASDVSGLPSALIVLAEFDPLYDEGLAYGEKMKTAGVSVSIQHYPTIHAFISKAHELDIGKEAISRIAQFLKSSIG